MPAITYGKAFTIGQDKRLVDTVHSIETSFGPMPDVYVISIHDVWIWCQRNLSSTNLVLAAGIINTAYGSFYDAGAITGPPLGFLGPLDIVTKRMWELVARRQ